MLEISVIGTPLVVKGAFAGAKVKAAIGANVTLGPAATCAIDEIPQPCHNLNEIIEVIGACFPDPEADMKLNHNIPDTDGAT